MGGSIEHLRENRVDFCTLDTEHVIVKVVQNGLLCLCQCQLIAGEYMIVTGGGEYP